MYEKKKKEINVKSSFLESVLVTFLKYKYIMC